MSNNNFFKSGFGSSFGSWSQFYKKNKTTITDSNGEVSVEAVEQIADQLNEQESILTNKVNQVQGKELSENDFTDADKSKLDGVEESANNYVHPTTHGINEVSGLDDALNTKRDKPTRKYAQVPIGSSGWYTIATCTNGRAIARFGLKDVTSGRHQSCVFYASHLFGDGNTINIIANALRYYNPIQEIRIKDKGSSDGAALQIYLNVDDRPGTISTYLLDDNFQSQGWNLVELTIDENTPEGISSADWGDYHVSAGGIDLLIGNGSLNTSGDVYAQNKKLATENTVNNLLDNKVDKVVGKVLSENDFTDADKSKLDSIESEANNYVHPSTHGINEVSGLSAALDSKVAKESGMGLSENDLTDDLMERLENGVTDNLDITTLQPKDAKISYNGIKEGAIKITLPQGYTATMMKLEVDIFDYLSHESIKILISGYNYSTNQIWKNTSVQILANKEHLNYPVRFGYDGGKCCIYIGELTSTWSYPKVVVSKGIFGYANFSYHQWISGWRIGIDNTGFQSISKTHTDNLLQNITDSEVAKLSGIESGANKYIHPSTHGMSEVSGLNSALNSKVDKVAGKALSENDFTDADKSKLDALDPYEIISGNQISGITVYHANLFDISKSGFYYATSISTNRPEGVNGYVLVEAYDEDNIKMTYSIHAKSHSYVVQKVGGTWGEWRRDEILSLELKEKLENLPDNLDLDANLSNKVDKVAGKELSENNFTDAYKDKLNASVVAQSDGKVGIATSDPGQGIAPDPDRKLMVNGGLSVKYGSKISYDPNYMVHAYTEYNQQLSESRFKNFGHFGHRWDTRNGTKMVLRGDSGYVGIGTTAPDNQLHIKGDNLKVESAHGYATIGSLNDHWFHFKTDRPAFYFYQPIHVAGQKVATEDQVDVKVDKVSGKGLSENDLTDQLLLDTQQQVDTSDSMTTLVPKDARLNLRSAHNLGALKIKLPLGYTSSMIKMTIDVYTYARDGALTIEVGGYTYSNLSRWLNTSAQILSSNENIDLPVRFGFEDGRCCVYIGDLDTNWSYPQIHISKICVGAFSLDPSHWLTGWDLSLETNGFRDVTSENHGNLVNKFTNAHQSKLDGIASGANNYVHPSTHTMNEISGLNSALAGKEATFSKKTAFNKNFGTTAGTVMQGNDSRLSNGQTAYSWGDHTTANYVQKDGSGKVGIGVNSPAMKLHLSDLDDYDGIKIGDHFQLRTSSSGSDSFVFEHTKTNGNLYIRSRSASGQTGRLALNDNGGNVGIGASSPQQKLHVKGGKARFETEYGYLDLGAENANWYHIKTDQSKFYFNKEAQIDGDIKVYGTNTYMRKSDGAIFENNNRVATQGYADQIEQSIQNDLGDIQNRIDRDRILRFNIDQGRGELQIISNAGDVLAGLPLDDLRREILG